MSDPNYKLSFSVKSFDDINGIQTYTEITFGEIPKIRYEAKLKEGLDKIARMPTIGHSHKLLPSSIRVYNIEKHIVIYKILEEESIVLILCVVHNKVNLAEILEDNQ